MPTQTFLWTPFAFKYRVNLSDPSNPLIPTFEKTNITGSYMNHILKRQEKHAVILKDSKLEITRLADKKTQSSSGG